LQAAITQEDTTKRILIVDDDPAMAKGMSHLLTHYGFDVTVSSTLREAREQSSKGTDLIVLDVNLPDGNGLTLLEELKVGGKTVPVFVLTADTQGQTDRTVRRLLPKQHFHKPFDFLEILQAVRGEFAGV
jgi:DNA-binding response OmpR family regulator